MGIFQHWPNRITAMRLVGAAALFALFAVWGNRDPHEIRGVLRFAFWLFVATAVTDFFDGWLARRGNLVSPFGRVADPFCDKVLTLGSMIFLAVVPWDATPLFPAWIVVVILARELLITGIRGYLESLGVPFPADRFGKIKMVVQCVAIGELLWIYGYDWSPQWYLVWWWLGRALVLATLLTTVLSGLNYVAKSRSLLMQPDA